MLLHIPHSSTLVPGESEYTEELKETKDKMTDHFTDDLFDYPVQKVIFEYSRVWCDVERYEDPRKEPQEKYNQGMIYTNSVTGTHFRDITQKTKDKILKEYRKHHRILTEKAKNHKVLVDCHSFYPVPLYGEAQGERPDFCLGCGNYTPEGLKEKIKLYLEKLGYTVKINSPFEGSLVPGGSCIKSIMIEVNRKLYLTQGGQGTNKSKDYYKTKGVIKEVLGIIEEHRDQGL